MTGPEHYREAERLNLEAESLVSEVGNILATAKTDAALIVGRAMVHATLALAAASVADRLPGIDREAWQEATA